MKNSAQRKARRAASRAVWSSIRASPSSDTSARNIFQAREATFLPSSCLKEAESCMGWRSSEPLPFLLRRRRLRLLKEPSEAPPTVSGWAKESPPCCSWRSCCSGLRLGRKDSRLTLTGAAAWDLWEASGAVFFSTGAAGAGVTEGACASAAGAFLSAAFLAGFTVFALAAVFGADLTVLILGASTEAASAAGFFSAAAAFLVVEAVFLAAVLRVAVFLAADASGAPVSNGFFAIKFQVKERIMNQFRRLSRFITEPHPEGPANLSKAPCTFPNQRGDRPPPSH